MAHPYSANTTATTTVAPDLRGLLAAASHHLGAALGALALHDNITLAADTTVADTTNDSLINFCEASLARLSLAEPQTAMELDTTAMELDLSVPRPRLHSESPKERVARRKLHLNNLHTPAKPKKPTTSTCSSSSATAASSSAPDPAAVLLIDRTLAPARNVRARGF